MVGPSPDRLLIDPSLLLSEPFMDWLEEDGDARARIVNSSAFRQALPTASVDFFYPFLQDYEALEALQLRRRRLLALLEGVDSFSSSAVTLPQQDAEVLGRLIETNQMVFADEWTFLQSQSWMASELRSALDAFRDAGSAVLEFGRRLRDQLIQGVIPAPGIPADITAGFFLRRTAPKWLVIGAPAVALGALGGPFGGALGAGVGLFGFPIVRAFDP